LQVIWFAVVPQIVLPCISDTIFRWDINVRMATILGFVGGGGIGTMLMEYQGQARWPQVGTIIVVIAVVVWVMDAFSAHVRQAIK
jgi:phosphonate transport system permease protein